MAACLRPVECRALRIGVDQDDAPSFSRPGSGEMQGQRGLADAALLVEKRDDHGAPRRPKAALAPAPRIACASVKEEELDSLLDSSIESGDRKSVGRERVCQYG